VKDTAFKSANVSMDLLVARCSFCIAVTMRIQIAMCPGRGAKTWIQNIEQGFWLMDGN